jgi:hypothetical protein
VYGALKSVGDYDPNWLPMVVHLIFLKGLQWTANFGIHQRFDLVRQPNLLGVLVRNDR